MSVSRYHDSHCISIGIMLVSKPANNQCCINRHLSVSFVSISLFVGCSSLVLSSVPLVGLHLPMTALPWVSVQFSVCTLSQQLSCIWSFNAPGYVEFWPFSLCGVSPFSLSFSSARSCEWSVHLASRTLGSLQAKINLKNFATASGRTRRWKHWLWVANWLESPNLQAWNLLSNVKLLKDWPSVAFFRQKCWVNRACKIKYSGQNPTNGANENSW